MEKGERSENEDGMAMGKEEMGKPGQDTWREGQNNGKRNLKKLSTTLTTYSPRNGKRKAAILTRLVIQINLLAHLRKK